MSGIEILILSVTGLFAGTFGTMIGIGGGVIFVPVLLLAFNFSPQEIIGTSLAAVFFNALSGSISYLRQKRVDIKAGWKFALATIPGAFLGAWLAKYFTGYTLELVFGLLLIAISLFVFFRKEPVYHPRSSDKYIRKLVDSKGEVFEYAPKEIPGIAISFVIGILSSLLGIGGGIIHVPALVYLLGFPVHIATATSHFVLAISAFSGSISHLILGHILYLPGVIIAAWAILGAQIGATVSRRVKGQIIARLLAIALLLVGIRLFLKATGIL